jgi:hypothetical protein
VRVDVGVSLARLPAPVEATAYFFVAEALTNARPGTTVSADIPLPARTAISRWRIRIERRALPSTLDG